MQPISQFSINESILKLKPATVAWGVIPVVGTVLYGWIERTLVVTQGFFQSFSIRLPYSKEAGPNAGQPPSPSMILCPALIEHI